MKKKTTLTVLTLVFLLVLFLNRSEARFLHYPIAFNSDDFQLPGGIVTTSSPTLADLDGDEVPEVLVGTTACRGNMQGTCTYDQATFLAVVKGDGNIWWSRDVGAPIGTAPAVADINDDGYSEVVVSLKGDIDDPNPYHGGLVAYTYDGLTELWRFYTQDQHPKDGYGDFVVSSPTLCDVDGDEDMEIAFGGGDQRIYLLDHNGNSLWNDLPNGFPGPGYMNADTIWSTAACADLNQDGQQEIIIGADITGGGVLPDGTVTQDGGFLYVFDIHGNVLVRRHLPETIYAAPAIGDLEGDGDLEIVSGTGWYWWHARGRMEQPYVYAFDTSQVFSTTLSYTNTNKLPCLPGWPQPTAYPGFSSPALADLDGDEDGDLEVVIGAGHPDSSAGDGFPGAGLVYAWHHDGEPVSGWPVAPENAQGKDGWLSSSPTIADVDADGGLEVLFSMLWDVQVYNADGSFQERLETNWTVWGSPAVGDADGDSYLEVWIGSSNVWEDPAYGYLWRFESDISGIGELPWPMFHRDAQNAGAFIESDPDLQVVPTDIAMPFVKGQSPADQQFTVTNSGGAGSTLDWHATVDWTGSAATEWFSLSTTSGSLAVSASETVDISVEDTKVQSPGTYRGTINVSGVEQSATVIVEYVVPPPALQLGATDVAFLMEPTDDEKSLQVTLRNAGGGTIEWSVPADYPAWLQVDPQSGILESTSALTLTVDKAGLSEGTHTASVRVEPVDLDPQTIGVKLYIGPVQKIFLPLALRH
jgi:hypothetical protein